MNELIKVTEQNGKSVVEARELHSFLESKQEFANWIKKRIEEYGFVENQDYTSFDKIIKREKGATTLKEYTLTLDMAKELAMVERSEKGRMARRYFIEVEKRYRAAINTTRADNALLRNAVAIAGSQAKLAKRLNISEGTMSDLLSGNKQLSFGLVSRVETICKKITEQGIQTDHDLIENLLKVNDRKVRMALFNSFKKGGVL